MRQVAHHLHVAPSTVRSWFLGRHYETVGGLQRSEALLRAAQGEPVLLSFHNLVEVHMLRALRVSHGSSMGQVRSAMAYAEKHLDINRLLLREDLHSAAGDVFLHRLGELINLSRSGQISMRRVWQRHLERVVFDDDQLPGRLFPFFPSAGAGDSDARTILIDPRIDFGHPVVASRGISTAVIVRRLNAGEDVQDLAVDFQLDACEIEDAVAYEEAA
jgi:uncharacterized protein (DUF433 family)